MEDTNVSSKVKKSYLPKNFQEEEIEAPQEFVTLKGTYKVISFLGSGITSEVLLVQEVNTKEKYALKLFKYDLLLSPSSKFLSNYL